MSFENWWMGELLPRRCLGALPQYYYGSMTPEELLYKIVYQLNELITNNNSIPTELREAIIEYINSQEFKDYIFSLTDPKYVSKTGDTMTGTLILNENENAHILKKYNSPLPTGGISILNIKSNTDVAPLSIIHLVANGKVKIYNLATPISDTEAANKKYVDDKVGALGNVLDFKGVKATEADLPTTGNKTGDVWYVEATKSAWAWVVDSANPGGRWDEFGPVINLEPYFKKADIVQTTGTATDKVMSQKASTDGFVNKAGDTMTGRLTIDPPSVSENYALIAKKRVGFQKGILANTSSSFTTGNSTDNPSNIALNLVQTNEYPYSARVSYPLLRLANGYGNEMVPYRVSGTVKEGFIMRVPGDNPPLDNTAPHLWFTVWNEPGMDLISLKTENLNLLPSYGKRIRLPGDIRIAQLADPVDAQDAATKAYVDEHSGGSYTLPVATNISLGGVIVSNPGTEMPVGYGSLRTQASETGALMVWLPFATADTLGGIKADESSEAMPVEIAIDPTTHKLKGALMTAYNSPTHIGGVVSNGEKTSDDTVPVKMDSDGKQWVKESLSAKSIIFPKDTKVKAITSNKNYMIASLQDNTNATSLWIDKIVKVDNVFNVTLNAVNTNDNLRLNYILFD